MSNNPIDDRTDEMAVACAVLLKVRTLLEHLEGKLEGDDEKLAQEIWEDAKDCAEWFMGDLEDWINASLSEADENDGFGYNLRAK